MSGVVLGKNGLGIVAVDSVYIVEITKKNRDDVDVPDFECWAGARNGPASRLAEHWK